MGRRASRLPPGANPDRFSAAEAWALAVERARAEAVDVVFLAGDVVDRENRFFEAFGPLERGLRELEREGIETVAVAGNHDHDVLPSLAGGAREGFALVGARGRWERHTVRRGGAPLLHVDGWSFPAETHRRDPAATYDLSPPEDGSPTVGLVHGDLGNPASPYAPLDAGALRSLPPLLWVLGHVHAPWGDTAPGAPGLLYPGSPMAMDPGEPGIHGGVVGRLAAGGLLEARRVPLSRIRYEVVTVDLEGVDDAGEARERVGRAVSEAARSAEEEGGGVLEALACRVRLTGRTPLHGELRDHLAEVEELAVGSGEVKAGVDGVEVETLPDRDLESLAQGGDPPGRLAALLLGLREARAGGKLAGDLRPLVEEAQEAVEAVHSKPHYRPVRHGLPGTDPEDRKETPDSAEAVQLLERQASLLLERLLSPGEGRS